MWQAGLVAGVQIEAYVVFYRPGFLVGSTSPQVPGHPTFICHIGIKEVKTGNIVML